MRQLLTLVCLILFLPLIFNAAAQSASDSVPEFSSEEVANLKRSFAKLVAGNTVFTSRDAVSTGRLNFDDGGEIDVLNLPFSHSFYKNVDGSLFQLRGAIGNLKGRNSIKELWEESLKAGGNAATNRPDFLRDEATSLSIGALYGFSPIQNLSIQMAFDTVWTHLRRMFDFNNTISKEIGAKYDRDLFNNSTEALSYSPSLALEYKVNFDGFIVRPAVRYAHFWTESLWSKSAFGDFNANYGVLQPELNVDIPLVVAETEVTLRPHVKATTLYGDARTAVDDETFIDYGLGFAKRFSSLDDGELFLGFSILKGNSFDGGRLDFNVTW